MQYNRIHHCPIQNRKGLDELCLTVFDVENKIFNKTSALNKTKIRQMVNIGDGRAVCCVNIVQQTFINALQSAGQLS